MSLLWTIGILFQIYPALLSLKSNFSILIWLVRSTRWKPTEQIIKKQLSKKKIPLHSMNIPSILHLVRNNLNLNKLYIVWIDLQLFHTNPESIYIGKIGVKWTGITTKRTELITGPCLKGQYTKLDNERCCYFGRETNTVKYLLCECQAFPARRLIK